MVTKKGKAKDFQELRKYVEWLLEDRVSGLNSSDMKMLRLLQELGEYQAELEIENKEKSHRLKKEREDRSVQFARLTRELTLAEHHERRRLAGILHDNLQQLLAGARLHMELLFEAVDRLPAFHQAYNLIIQSIETTRSLSADLSPPILYQKGLTDALRWLAKWMMKTHCLEVDLYLDESGPTVREELRVLLFQSVQELLFNTIKHAHTNTARLEMKCSDAYIRIVVSDQGAGSDDARIQNCDNPVEGGFGLSTIRERIKLLGGDFHVVSTPGHGTSITLTAPLKKKGFMQAGV